MSYNNRYYTDGLTSRTAPSLAFDRQWDGKMNQLYTRIKKTTSTIPQQAGPTYMPSLRYKPLGGHLFKPDRLEAVAKDNVKLVRRMKDIYCREPTKTEEPPPALTSNDKQSKMSEIERENFRLVGRLKKTKGVIDTRSYLEQYKDHCVIMARQSKRNPDRYLHKIESTDLDIDSIGRSPSHVRLAPVNGRRSTVGERYSTGKSDASRRSNSSLYHQDDEHHSSKRERSHRSRRSEQSAHDDHRRRERSHRHRRRSVDDPRGERGEGGTPDRVRDHRHRFAHQNSPPDDQGEASHHRRSPDKRHDDNRRHRRHRRDEDGDEGRDRDDKHSPEERRGRRERRGSRDRENDVKKETKELDDDFFN